MAEIYDGKKLKAMRKRLGLTQARLAKLAGVTQALISSVEHDVAEMASQDTRALIASRLVEMEHKRIVEMSATPNEKIQMLKAERAQWKYKADWAFDQLEKRDKLIAYLTEILNLRTKKALTDSEEKERIETLGLEQGPTVEEEAFRAEVAQQGRPKGQRVKKEGK